MRRFDVSIPVKVDVDGLTEVDGIVLCLTEDDVCDLNKGLSITTLTTQNEEVALFPIGAIMNEDDKIAERNYGYNELVSLPTLHESHFDNIKIQGNTVRVSLSRCGPEDGASRNDVTVERLIGGLWVMTRTYRAVRVRKSRKVSASA